MRKDTAAFDDGHQDKQQASVQRIDDVLEELLAQYSVRFPQLKIVIVGRTDDAHPHRIEIGYNVLSRCHRLSLSRSVGRYLTHPPT